ncbi:hypothetical protein [Geodermatophilus sp. CPCC 205506]|uniref:hypothetical protein n=1 Tax=Geodermatophilus sp. CPCC 205506 TaxID=2936596 RepID=UPI003EEA9104
MQHRGIRAALCAGAAWERIGAVLSTTPLTAWNSHQRWFEEQVELFELTGRDGLDDVGAVDALQLAGERPSACGTPRKALGPIWGPTPIIWRGLPSPGGRGDERRGRPPS